MSPASSSSAARPRLPTLIYVPQKHSHAILHLQYYSRSPQSVVNIRVHAGSKNCTIPPTEPAAIKVEDSANSTSVEPNTDVVVFTVHKSFLCHHSPYFAYAFVKLADKGVTQTLDIYDVDHEAFGMLVHYLYFQQVEMDRDNWRMDLSVKLYIIGEKYKMPAMQNKIINTMDLAIFGDPTVTPEVFQEVVNAISSYKDGHNLPARWLIQSMISGPASWIEAHSQQLSDWMLRELVVTMRKQFIATGAMRRPLITDWHV